MAAQGTALRRAGRVAVDRQADDTIWVGGHVGEVVRGTVEL